MTSASETSAQEVVLRDQGNQSSVPPATVCVRQALLFIENLRAEQKALRSKLEDVEKKLKTKEDDYVTLQQLYRRIDDELRIYKTAEKAQAGAVVKTHGAVVAERDELRAQAERSTKRELDVVGKLNDGKSWARRASKKKGSATTSTRALDKTASPEDVRLFAAIILHLQSELDTGEHLTAPKIIDALFSLVPHIYEGLIVERYKEACRGELAPSKWAVLKAIEEHGAKVSRRRLFSSISKSTFYNFLFAILVAQRRGLGDHAPSFSRH